MCNSLNFRLSDQNFLCIAHISTASYEFRLSHPSSVGHLNIWEVK